jgi:hypothetical protein
MAPTVEAEASIPNNMLLTRTLRRKVAKRTESWYLASPPPLPQDEETPATKKRRLDTLIATATAEAPDTPRSNSRATGVTGDWTREEDAELTSAVANSCKKMWCGSRVSTDWTAVAALVPGRTNIQCRSRWHNRTRWHHTFNTNIARPAGFTDKWTPAEDQKLVDSIQMHGGKNWAAITALMPGRTKRQCSSRWHNTLNTSIDRTIGRSDRWTEDEDNKLTDAIQLHGGKDWVAITALVPGRTKKQCQSRRQNIFHPYIAHSRRQNALHPKIAWTEDEENKLKDAIQMHGDKDWGAIAALVPFRTKLECENTWNSSALKYSIDRTAGRSGAWKKDEDDKLTDSVQLHGGKDWAAIATLVPGRTRRQCQTRWYNVLHSSIDQTSQRAGMVWTPAEDKKLKDSVQLHGGRDWAAIAALVPGRTQIHCRGRWHRNSSRKLDESALGKDPYSR